MRVLLVGGPFDWRTIQLPEGHGARDLYLPLPIKATVMYDYSVTPDMPTARYQRVAELFTHPVGLDSVPKGVVFEYRETR